MVIKKISSLLIKLLSKIKSPFTEPFAIIMVDGGIGSQIGKYIFGEWVRATLKIKVKYDLTWFDNNGLDCDNMHARKFQLLEIFPNINFVIASAEEIKKAKKNLVINNPHPFIYRDDLFNKKTNQYITGYYENWKYSAKVKEYVTRELDFSNIELTSENNDILNSINNDEASVAIHVRRGDYVNLGWCILNEDYYLRAIKEMEKKLSPISLHLYFFSNGMDWVKQKIIPKLSNKTDFSFVEINDNDSGYIDLYLITKCKHQISSNSSFGFIGALLNTKSDSEVIVPNKWLVGDNEVNMGNETAHNVPGWTVLPYKIEN